MVMSTLEKVEKRFGLPRLTELSKALESIPDERQLRELYKLLVMVDKVSASAPDLNQVVTLIHELNDLPTEKLVELQKLLREAQKLLAKAPQDLLDFLSSLKE